MGHPKELIEKFVAIMRETYKEIDGHVFRLEESLADHKPRIAPDIQVFDKDNKLISVVEIGYTRPEKIKIYRELGVQDIRWYSKEGELINAEEKTIVIKKKYVSHEEELFYRLDIEFGSGIIMCENCGDAWGDWCSEENKDMDILAETSCATVGELWCNKVRGILIYYCDQCDSSGFHVAGQDIAEDLLWALDIYDYGKFIQEHRKAQSRHLAESIYLKNIPEEKRSVFLDHDSLYGAYNRYIDECYIVGFEELKEHAKRKYDVDLDYEKIRDMAWDFLEEMKPSHR